MRYGWGVGARCASSGHLNKRARMCSVCACVRACVRACAEDEFVYDDERALSAVVPHEKQWGYDYRSNPRSLAETNTSMRTAPRQCRYVDRLGRNATRLLITVDRGSAVSVVRCFHTP